MFSGFGKSLCTKKPVQSQKEPLAKDSSTCGDALCKGHIARLIHTLFPPHTSLTPKEYLNYRNISILAIINIYFMICVFTPYAIYSSDVSQFDVSQTYQTLSALFGICLFLCLITIYITSFFYHTRLLKLGSYGVSVILCIGLVYTFVLAGNYGAMNHFVIQNPAFLDVQFRTQRFTYFFLSVGLSCLVVLVFFKWLKHIFGIIFITLSILTCVSFVQILYSTPKNTESSSQSIAPYENELFSYSKTHKNIVIFVLDMFSGSHTPYIFAQFPYLKDNLSGFVLFDNTLSTTDSTIHSIATLIGGEYYAAYNMNARGDNLKESITKAFDDMGAHFVQNGYDVAYSLAVSAQGIKALKQYQQSGIFAIENLGRFQSYYLYEQNLQEQVERIYKNTYKDYQIVQLFSVGLFRFAPELYFRPRIYRNGMWLLRDTEHKNSDTLASITASSSFYAYTHIGNTNATKPTFKYLHSLMTHVPYRMYFHNKKCQFFSDKSAWNDYEHNAQMIETNEAMRAYYYQHYDTEACALLYLNDYVQWLKDNDIYDNTQIFVVSDHSGFDSIDIPIYSRPDALFLFKDFNAQGALEVDSRLMANYDIVSIFCENLPKGCPNVAPNVLKSYPKNRKVIHTLPISWIIDLHKTNQWIFNAAYIVDGDMHNKEHWRSIPLQDNQIPSELLHAH